MVERRVAVGAPWAGPMLERLRAALEGWRVDAGAALNPEIARSASVLVPCAMKVDRDVLANSKLRLIQQLGVGVDSIDFAATAEFGIPVANAPSEHSGMAASVAE